MRALILTISAVLMGLSLRAMAAPAPLPVSLLYKPVPMILTPREGRAPRAATPVLPAALVTTAAEPLFTADERENLKAIGAGDLALSLKLEVASPSAAETLKAWCKEHLPGWVLEENAKAELHQMTEDQLQRYQWGLMNAGRSQGFALDNHRVAELPAEVGQDIGAYPPRSRGESETAVRPRVLIAVMDTGLDYDRDTSGKITGVHSEFKGQLVDKTAKGDECDPGEATKPEQMLEGPRGRRARFKACVASAATDCLTRPDPDGRPDFDRDRNGYPLDCMGWNVTAALTRATDLLGDDDTRDKLGHGTHVAGIIAAAADGDGVRGVVTRNVAILPVKVVDRAPNQPIIPQEVACRKVGDSESHDLFSEEQGSCSLQKAHDIVRAMIEIPDARKVLRRPEVLAKREAALDPLAAAPPPPEDDLTPQERILNPRAATLGFTDQIARGMLYAIRSKADIISMSLAWPSDADSELMKRLTKLARASGILVVASSGNDATEARTIPCQYSSVICVASHGPSGALSYFSNHGAAVDVAAPGQNMLSTWPRVLRGGRKWTSGPAGYEQKSGTSMAAPMVAGVLARLLNDGFKPDEAQARLYAGTRPLKAVRTGNVDLGESERAQEAPIIMPDPKGPVSVSWDPASETAPFSISLKNYWSAAVAPKVELDLGTAGEPTLEGSRIELLSPASFSDWAPLESKTIDAVIRFPGDPLTRMKLNGQFTVTVRVTSANAAPRSFEVPFELVATISSGSTFPGATEIPIEGNPVLNGDVLTVVSKDGDPALEYMAIDADQNGLTMRLFRELPAQPPLLPRFAQAGQATLPRFTNFIRLADVQRVDHTAGQKSGYVLIFETRAAEGNTTGLRFDFFDHDLSYLKERLLRYDNVVSGIDDEHWVWMKYGNYKVPSWVGFGLLPKEEYPDPDFYPTFYLGQCDPDDQRAMQALRDVNKASHTREQGRRILFDSMRAFGQDHFQRNRLYFLEPFERKELDPATGAPTGEPKAIARTGAANPKLPYRRGLRTREGRTEASSTCFHNYVPIAFLSQTAQERKDGSIRVLLATPEKNASGEDLATLRYAMGKVKELKTADASAERAWIIEELVELLKFDETKNIAGVPDVSQMIPLGLKNQLDPRATFMGQPLELGRYEANMLIPNASRAAGVEVLTQPLNPPAPTDSVFHAAGVFHGPGRLAMFGETHYDLQYNDLSRKERAVTSLGRFSFMPQAVVSKSLMPVVVRNESGGDLIPGMLIPAQLRSSANMEVIIPSYNVTTGKLERLIRPARLRLQAGQGCRALKLPTLATEHTGPALMFLCDGRFIQVPLSY